MVRYLVVGAGAVGGYLGALLVDAGKDVTFLVRQERAELLRDSGLRLDEGPLGVRNIEVRTATAEDVRADYDVVLLSVKAFALEAAIEDIRPAITDATALIPSLNGIAHIAKLTAAFPGSVLGGVILVATELEPDGAIRVITPGASIRFGELDGTDSARVARIAIDLEGAEVAAAPSPTITADMWEKWLFLASAGALNTLIGTSVGESVTVSGGEATALGLVQETVDVMTLAGHAPREAAVRDTRAKLTDRGSHFTTSMFRDYAAGRRVEVEPILGDLVRIGGEHGMSTPLLTAAAARLRVPSR